MEISAQCRIHGDPACRLSGKTGGQDEVTSDGLLAVCASGGIFTRETPKKRSVAPE